MTSARLSSPRLAIVAGLLAGFAVAAAGAEVVILKDGFVIQGNVRKEVTSIHDPTAGKTFPIAKADGFDMIDEGPKVFIFSTHAKQLGEVSKDTKLRPQYKAYTRLLPGSKPRSPLPGGVTKSSTEFDEKWRRKIEVRVPPSFEIIEQQITYIDPYFVYMVSPTHFWRATYRTSEMDPAKIRKLLSTHPELAEPDGKPDAAKRVALAKFMLDVGWLQIAKDDIERIRRTFPDGVPKEAKEAFESLVKEVDQATAALVIKEAELALAAGRYGYAGELLAVFPEKLATAKQIDDMTKLKAQWKLTSERYDDGHRLLRNLLDEVTGMNRAKPTLAVAGGPAAAVWPRKVLQTPLTLLVEAGETVYAEVHPDSVHRIESFITLAAQAEREKLQGRDPTKKPDELLATAVSGWAKGKNGATPDPAQALRIWAARQTVLDYQRADDLNTRNEILARYKKEKPIPIDELAQIVSLLPPAEPEDLSARTGAPVPAENGIPRGIYKRNSAPSVAHPNGIPYYVKLPPEYHPGRAYPVLVVLTHPTVEPEQMIGSLAHESDRNGYILLAPEWSGQFGQGWLWRGEDHAYVTDVLRDAVRHFCVDNDRVFLIGAADGANMAMDVGMSHPDLFAGVVAMGPIPKWRNMFEEYWRNAQKLPFYIVTGEMSGDSATNLRNIFQKWMPRGFPGMMVVYKGRGIEWYAAEVPVIFDWMGRKKRVNGTAVLALGNARQPWTTMRPTDNRFYWLGVDKIVPHHLIDNLKGQQIVPAEIQGDIRGNNLIDIRSRGVSRVSIWLTQDMIDWGEKVRVNLNGSSAPGWKAKVLEPDVNLLLEDYRERGDRRVLMLGRLEFNTVP
jgi:pimeloyl-ACP methyl ester carboxylesterase